MRDQLLFKAKSQMKIKDQEVMVLKDIPWRMINRRKNYVKLVNILKENGIMFKWLMPEGLLVYFKGTRFNINSIFKMENFIKNNQDLILTKEKNLGLEEHSESEEELSSSEEGEDEDSELEHETKGRTQEIRWPGKGQRLS